MLTQFLELITSLSQEMRGTPDWNSPVAWRRKGAAAGLLGLDLPAKYAEHRLTAREMAKVFALCGELDLDLRDVPGAGHGRLLAVAERLDAEQEGVLRGIATGREYVAIVITEEHGGSDLHGLKTVAVAVPGGEGFVLSGEKRFVARLKHATRMAVFAKVGSASDEALTAFLVPTDAPGVHISELPCTGLHGSGLGAVTLERVQVCRSQIIEGLGEGFKLFDRHFSYWRTATAAAAIGCARGALKQAIGWLSSRQAFGGPIGRFTHLQQELGRHVANLHMAWLHVVATMDRIDENQPSFIFGAMAKAEAVEAALEAASWAMRIHGAVGYTPEMDLEKRVRDLLGLRVADGATDVLRGQVARSLLGDEMYEYALGRKRDAARSHALLISDFLT